MRDRTPKHQWPVDVSPYDSAGKLLPEISPLPKGEPGSADKRVQAYNFRIIATDRPGNRLPWPKPEGYDPGRYALMARLIQATVAKTGQVPVMHQVLQARPHPRRQGRHQQPRRILDRLHRRFVGLPRGLLHAQG
ncbi:MAG: FAD-dependent oxidoreductase [Bryobacterales bacterium]